MGMDLSFFTYDIKKPLELTILAERKQGDAIVQDITYASPYGGRVSANLIIPGLQKPQAGLIFAHWGEGNREEFVDEAIVLTESGFVSLCLDAPYRRAPENEPQQEPPQTELQWISDVQHGVDLLLEVFKLTPKCLGYIGHSYGASYGGTLAGIEQRIKAYVLMAGWHAAAELLLTSENSIMVQQRQTTPIDELNAYVQVMAPLDAQHYIGKAAPSHLLFQHASDDAYVTREEEQHYFDLASEPKEVRWYENGGHALNAQARIDRVKWLSETLELDPVKPGILDKLERVVIPEPIQSGE